VKKARLKDGQVILAHQYDRDAHGTDMLCADPDCSAHMGFRKEALTHGSLALKSAHFFSRSAKEHRADCNAYEEFSIQARARKSIEQALKEGKTIVINLNVRLMEDFNGVAGALVCQPSTNDVRNYVAVGAKSVEDVLDYMETIEKKAGKDGIARTRINYQGQTLPLDEFVIDSRDKYRSLLNKMYLTLQKTPPAAGKTGPDALHSVQEIVDFPRLIRFKATHNTRAGTNKILRGTPIQIQKNKTQRIVLLQRAQTGKQFRQTLRGEDVHLIARPALHRYEATRAQEDLQQGKPVVFIDMHWKVVSATQFTPAETPAAEQKPHPKQDKFGF